MYFKMRHEAKLFAREILDSLENNRSEWCLAENGLTHGKFSIVITPRRLRMNDQVQVFNGKTEIWIPFLIRLRLRDTARYVISCRSLFQWDATHPNGTPADCDESGDCGACCVC